jgi:hypothetical protein
MCVRLTHDEIVIRCRNTATVTTVGFVDGPTPAAITVRDGDLEIAIEGLTGSGEAHPDAPSTDAIPALLLPARSPCPGETLSVQEAEWFELDDESAEPSDRPRVTHVASAPSRPRARSGDSGDAPTRIHRLEEVLGETEFAIPRSPDARGVPPRRPDDPAAARKVVVPRGRLSPGARRFALLGLLACSLMLCLRARRVKEAAARAPQATVQQALERPAAAPADSSAPYTAGAARPMPGRTAAPPHAQPNKGSPTKARRAADALAEGDNAEALELYEGLASEEANPAYARIVDSLRSRPPTSP